MRFTNLCALSLPVALMAALALFQCEGPTGGQSVERPDVLNQIPDGTDSEIVGPAGGCDPDGIDPCPEGWFLCYMLDNDTKVCISREPVTPGGNATWDCQYVGDSFVCQGGTLPPEDGGWDCEKDEDGVVTCHRDGQSYYPSIDIDGEWDCWFDHEYVVCQTGEDGGIGVPPEETPDGGSTMVACLCAPGSARYCDTPNYCSWGIQYCDDDGMGWGECTETDPADGCTGEAMNHGGYFYSRPSEECCIRRGHCCQDFWDIDGDNDNQESLGNCVEPEPVCHAG